MKNSTAFVLLNRFVQTIKSENCSVYGFNLKNPLVNGMKPTKQTSWKHDMYKINITSDGKIIPLIRITPRFKWEEAEAIDITPETNYNTKGVIELLNDLPDDVKNYLRELFKKEEG